METPRYVILLWLLGGSVVVGVLIGVPLVWLRRRLPSQTRANALQREQATEFKRAGMTVVTSSARGTVVCGKHAGVSFESYTVGSGSKLAPPNTVARIPTQARGEFFLDTLTTLPQSTDEYVRSVFENQGNLEAARAIFAAGFGSLEKSGGHLVATWMKEPPPGPAVLKQVVEQLAKLKLPGDLPGGIAGRLLGSQVLNRLRALTATVVAAGIVGIAITNPLLDGWGVFAVNVMLLDLALCAAFLGAAWYGLKGKSIATRATAEVMAHLCALAVTLVGALALANELLDGSEAETHESRIVMRYMTTSGKSGRGHVFHVQMTSWRSQSVEEIRVSEAVYFGVQEGQSVQVRTHRGWLGQAWVESVRPR